MAKRMDGYRRTFPTSGGEPSHLRAVRPYGSSGRAVDTFGIWNFCVARYASRRANYYGEFSSVLIHEGNNNGEETNEALQGLSNTGKVRKGREVTRE